jgi:MOSC domain-containing protein YiiM
MPNATPAARPTAAELEARWAELEPAPRGQGAIELLVLRTGGGARSGPDAVDLDPELGVVGDRWAPGDHPECQVTLMNVRAARLVTEGLELHLPGDNAFVDLDLSAEALPVGSRVRLGTALLEVTPEPHLGCGKFAARMGAEALKWINAKAHRDRRLRGVNCRVLEAGRAAVGDRAVVEG